jgi:hypothetical protein
MRGVKLIVLVLVNVALRRSFQESAILSEALTSTFHNLLTPEGQFSKTWRRKAIFWGESDNGFSYSEIDEILVSHLTRT